MKADLLNGHESVSHAARICRVETVPHYPAPKSMEISVLPRIHQCDFYDVESQSSAVTAAAAASLAERRVLLPLSEIKSLDSLKAVSSVRAPVVSALWGSAAALRDLGWLILVPSTNQEAFDMVIQAYMLAEDRKVLLPAAVAIDLQIREGISIPSDQMISNMLPKLRLPRRISAKEANVFDASERSEEQMQKAMENAKLIIQKIDEKWKAKFRRGASAIEPFMAEDAEFLFVIAGYQSETCRAAVRKLRAQGEKAGMIRLRVLRPWPGAEVARALEKAKMAAVIEPTMSIGAAGVLHTHVKAASPVHSSSFIAKSRLQESDFMEMFQRMKKEAAPARYWV
jgi:pyruvate/2-oxoacid:ferredoxin oxidoreductase alpha subunit